MITIVPFSIVIIFSLLFFAWPEQSNAILSKVRFFFGDTFGTYYLIIGLGFFIMSLFLAMSKYGDIVLGGKDEKPKYSFFAWGCMMFTCGLAADILFYSFSEWVMYATNPHLADLGSVQDWAGVFPIFHWSLIPWAFYLVLAVAFGFMLHVRKQSRQKYSEACRPILGKHTDGVLGRVIDLLAVFALLAGTATTFSIATPLMASIITELFHVEISRTAITIVILIFTCAVYTYSLLHGFKGISILAKVCIFMFFGLNFYVLAFGGEARYIIDTGFESLGRMVQNFIGLSTYTDPLRKNNFPQDWTIYYWAYWMVWCVAAPFFIGNISKGRTIRQTLLGGYVFGVGSTILSFIVLGNYSLGQQTAGVADYMAPYIANGDLYAMIISVINTLPCAPLVLVLVLLTMVAFYATSFDSIAYTASCYSYHKLEDGETPHKLIQLMVCILLIILPIALVFSESSMSNLQSVSILAAFPIGLVMILIVVSFLKDGKNALRKENRSNFLRSSLNKRPFIMEGSFSFEKKLSFLKFPLDLCEVFNCYRVSNC
nr:BCCT family transporter [Fibrobacter sp. UWR1]